MLFGKLRLRKSIILKQILELEAKALVAVWKGSATAGLMGFVVSKINYRRCPWRIRNTLINEYERLGSDQMNSLYEAMTSGSVALAKSLASALLWPRAIPFVDPFQNKTQIGMLLSLL
ncbi:hypothetical protein ROZALSC1DRAFT_22816 [Rozella allomycis CSF55]|uniref:Uncharacterized protein n=1 Tax=Rozella allomycis (strain CSF55) TaxID=988480 RepID=A0A4P9YK72_ROZAC|nr:hypothetical protein ROZALSC1DRAFT_22816 [Rozella allomycis CSF55]